MTILVSLALEAEFAPWRGLRTFHFQAGLGSAVHRARIADADVVVTLTGIGAPRVEDLRHLIKHFQPRAGVVAGVAAALKPELRAGDILVAQSVRRPCGAENIPCDPDLLRHAVQAGARPVQNFVTVDRMLRAAETKSALSAVAEAAEMESFAVMRCLSRDSVPAMAVRAIADEAAESLPWNFEAATDTRGQLCASRLLVEMIRRPSELPRAVRFGMKSRRATVELARYLDRLMLYMAGRLPADSAESPAGSREASSLQETSPYQQ